MAPMNKRDWLALWLQMGWGIKVDDDYSAFVKPTPIDGFEFAAFQAFHGSFEQGPYVAPKAPWRWPVAISIRPIPPGPAVAALKGFAGSKVEVENACQHIFDYWMGVKNG